MEVFYNNTVIGTFKDNAIVLSPEKIFDWKPDLIERGLENLGIDEFKLSVPQSMFISIETSYDSELEKYFTIVKLKDRQS